MVGRCKQGHRSKFSSSQGALEIEAGISRLPGRDRPMGRKQSATEHMIAGAVDGLDTNELAGLVTEGRERARGTVTA